MSQLGEAGVEAGAVSCESRQAASHGKPPETGRNTNGEETQQCV